MKVVLLAVTSLNGKITRGDDPIIYSWTSKEDQKQFFQRIEAAKLIIMGSKTFKPSRYLIKHKKGRTRVVLTRTPEKYKAEEVPEMLEFTNEAPSAILKRFKGKGVTEALLIGGSEINSLFLKSKLVDEIHLTVEPLLFGTGKNILSELNFNTELRLLSLKKLNKHGALQLIYKANQS